MTAVLIAIAVTGLVLNVVNLVMSPVSFWDLMQLSDFGLFVQLVKNNPVLTIGSGALWLIGIGGLGFRMYGNR